MKVVLVLCGLFFSAAWAFPKGQNALQFKRLYVDPKIEGLPKDLVPRITGGQEAVPHSIPYQTHLVIESFDGSRWVCGGSIISPTHILTAAHCLDEGFIVTAYLGAHRIFEAEPSVIYALTRTMVIHEEYDEESINNDIGLVVLDEPIQFNENISAVALPSNDPVSNYEGANARMSGWGVTEETGNRSPVLREANATVISNELCDSVYGIVTDSKVCTLGDAHQGTCNGDSGGPLIVGTVQIGIVSFGATGCPEGLPSAYTRVTSFLDWIEEKTGLNF